MHADVIVVGAGLSGMMAALTAESAGAHVILADRGPIGKGTNSALSNGAFAGPPSADKADEYVQLVTQIGKGLNCPASVRQIAREASAAIEFLYGLGIGIEQRGSHWSVRSPMPGTIPGITLVQAVSERVLARPRIRVERGAHVVSLRHTSGRVSGARGFTLSGDAWEAEAPAVILACGGAGALYAKNDNQQTMLGQGYLLAATAALDLWDMEFVQFYPIVLDEPGLPAMMIYPPYPPEARLLTSAGEDLLAKHDLGDINQAIVRKRDTFAALIADELRVGAVRMDLRAVPVDRWNVHPLSLLTRFSFDFRTRPVRITPGAHFFMGGVQTDQNGQTAVPGLFACGEMLWGLHGANRMGGNALTECLVSGRVAGRSAIRGNGVGTPRPDAPSAAAWLLGAGKNATDLRALHRKIRTIAWETAAITRCEEGMREGLKETEGIWVALLSASAATPRERILRKDLLSAAFTLRAVLTAGLGRLESRGSFLRTDYPAQDDGHWLRNSRLVWDAAADSLRVEYVPAQS